MLNRRYIRVKVLQALYAYWQSCSDSKQKSLHEMFMSMEKIYVLYLYLLKLFDEIRNTAQVRIEKNKNKKLPTSSDLNPNLKFVRNELVSILSENKFLLQAYAKHHISWKGAEDVIHKVYRETVRSVEYKQYMEEQENSYQTDRDYCINWFRKIILPMGRLHHFFEEQSIYWHDDYFLVCFNVIKTLKNVSERNGRTANFLMPLYKNRREDEAFTRKLFFNTIDSHREYTGMIAEKTKNWEVDRIALVDAILMQMAICEILQFENIPVKVTLNEYIEISKDYSTPRSRVFINGILDHIVEDLKAEGRIIKKGRGLVE